MDIEQNSGNSKIQKILIQIFFFSITINPKNTPLNLLSRGDFCGCSPSTILIPPSTSSSTVLRQLSTLLQPKTHNSSPSTTSRRRNALRLYILYPPLTLPPSINYPPSSINYPTSPQSPAMRS